ncbi:MAG: ATPase, T2SS/T4P/T4SS family [Promethearchaeota archaeon]|jgi:Flp pilus assembly CpaF family ATPase
MVLKDVSYFEEKENFKGKREHTLVLDCNNCNKKEEKKKPPHGCLNCILHHLYLNKDRKFSLISILSNDVLIEKSKFEDLLTYFKKLNKIKKILGELKDIRENKCKFVEFKCTFFKSFSIFYRKYEKEFYNPNYIYDHLLKFISDLKSIKLTNNICQKCHQYFLNSLKFILDIFNGLEIIEKYKDPYNGKESFPKTLLSKIPYQTDTSIKFDSQSSRKNNVLLTKYKTGHYRLFQVSIFKSFFEKEKIYTVQASFKESEKKSYLEKIINDVMQDIEISQIERITPLEDLIEAYNKKSIKILNTKYTISKSEKERISFLVTLKKLHLSKLFPLLIDDLVEEVFLDSPSDHMYINHRIYSRCRTEIGLNSKEIERVKTLVRLYSGKRLDYMNPSIKLVLKNKYFYCRFAIDVDPIQIHNFAMDIRKLNKNIYTIQDLLKNGTLDSKMAAFLYFNILRRRNITVIGETDTGKTTLINTLDLLTPKEFRKIYVENIVESLNQSYFSKHQLKYRVDSLDDDLTKKYSKSEIIKTLLHRTPDLIYLGEILTKEEAEAMFHCLSAGLKGFQTIHASNLNALINRFLYHFNIEKTCLSDLDLIIFMRKEINKRRITSISEIKEAGGKDETLFNLIFKYNPSEKNWAQLETLYETKVITDLKDFEEMGNKFFVSIMKIYIEIFDYISKINKLDNAKLIELFHKISYFSMYSLDSLADFWTQWKKNRSLYLKS